MEFIVERQCLNIYFLYVSFNCPFGERALHVFVLATPEPERLAIMYRKNYMMFVFFIYYSASVLVTLNRLALIIILSL